MYTNRVDWFRILVFLSDLANIGQICDFRDMLMLAVVKLLCKFHA